MNLVAIHAVHQLLTQVTLKGRHVVLQEPQLLVVAGTGAKHLALPLAPQSSHLLLVVSASQAANETLQLRGIERNLQFRAAQLQQAIPGLLADITHPASYVLHVPTLAALAVQLNELQVLGMIQVGHSQHLSPVSQHIGMLKSPYTLHQEMKPLCRVWSARRYWPLTCRRLHDAGIAYRLAPFPAPLSLGLLLDWLLLGFIVLVPTEG